MTAERKQWLLFYCHNQQQQQKEAEEDQEQEREMCQPAAAFVSKIDKMPKMTWKTINVAMKWIKAAHLALNWIERHLNGEKLKRNFGA